MLLLAAVLAAGVSGFKALPSESVATADAAACVRIVGGVFDSPGNDNYMPYLNSEWVRIKNFCATRVYLSSWTIKDYGSKHTYRFATGDSIRPGYTLTLHSGTGTNSTYHRYWQRSYGAVWNNTAPERAYLRNAAGTLQSSWSLY
jgi:micrococcal nuclease